MQRRLEEMADFGSKIKNGPVELLKRIQKLIHTPEKETYHMEVLCEILMQQVNLR